MAGWLIAEVTQECQDQWLFWLQGLTDRSSM